MCSHDFFLLKLPLLSQNQEAQTQFLSGLLTLVIIIPNLTSQQAYAFSKTLAGTWTAHPQILCPQRDNCGQQYNPPLKRKGISITYRWEIKGQVHSKGPMSTKDLFNGGNVSGSELLQEVHGQTPKRNPRIHGKISCQADRSHHVCSSYCSHPLNTKRTRGGNSLYHLNSVLCVINIMLCTFQMLRHLQPRVTHFF